MEKMTQPRYCGQTRASRQRSNNLPEPVHHRCGLGCVGYSGVRLSDSARGRQCQPFEVLIRACVSVAVLRRSVARVRYTAMTDDALALDGPPSALGAALCQAGSRVALRDGALSPLNIEVETSSVTIVVGWASTLQHVQLDMARARFCTPSVNTPTPTSSTNAFSFKCVRGRCRGSAGW